jgi:cell wall-associated NlpC family hydrolase
MIYSLINKMPEDQLIRKYVGVPYQHRGRSMDGLDCWGVIRMIYADHGIDVIDLEQYDLKWARQGKDHFLGNYSSSWIKIELTAQLECLDVILFFNDLGVASHAGIYLSKGRFIQAVARSGVVVTPLNQIWRGKTEGIYRYDKNLICK